MDQTQQRNSSPQSPSPSSVSPIVLRLSFLLRAVCCYMSLRGDITIKDMDCQGSYTRSKSQQEDVYDRGVTRTRYSCATGGCDCCCPWKQSTHFDTRSHHTPRSLFTCYCYFFFSHAFIFLTRTRSNAIFSFMQTPLSLSLSRPQNRRGSRRILNSILPSKSPPTPRRTPAQTPTSPPNHHHHL